MEFVKELITKLVAFISNVLLAVGVIDEAIDLSGAEDLAGDIDYIINGDAE